MRGKGPGGSSLLSQAGGQSLPNIEPKYVSNSWSKNVDTLTSEVKGQVRSTAKPITPCVGQTPPERDERQGRRLWWTGRRRHPRRLLRPHLRETSERDRDVHGLIKASDGLAQLPQAGQPPIQQR